MLLEVTEPGSRFPSYFGTKCEVCPLGGKKMSLKTKRLPSLVSHNLLIKTQSPGNSDG